VKDKLTLIGAVYNGDSAIGSLAEASFKLAVEDFNAGATMANGNAVGLVACNSAGDPEQASAAARHLAEVVGVPAILGPLDDDDFVEVANKVSVVPGNLIFTMSPTAIAPTGESDSGVLWRTIPGAEYHGKALRDRLLGGGFGSVIMVFRGDNYGLGIYQAMTEDNGMGQRIIPGVGNQSNLSYSANENGASQLDTLLGVIPDPEAVVLLGGAEVEDQLKHIASLGIAPKRIFVSNAGLRGIQGALQATGDTALAARIELIAPVSEHPDNKSVLYSRLQERNQGITLGTEAPLSYDAAMTTLLAMRAIGDGKTLTGPVIAQQMSRLTSGAPISFGDIESLAFVKDAANALGGGGSIDMIGNSGELAFVLAKGQPCSPFVSWGFNDVASPVPVQVASYATACPDATGTWTE
jgi:hypothetical protein